MQRRKTMNARTIVLLMASVLVCWSFSTEAQTLQLVSVPDTSLAPAAGGGGDSYGPILSADGRYVVFASTANNLMVTTNNTPIPSRIPANLNVFLRDRTNGSTTLVSVNVSGVAGGNLDSIPVDVSTNGQYVLFDSSATDLMPGDTNNTSDVFVRDLANGTTILVSVNTNGVAGNGASHGFAITPDGRFVAFVSTAGDLVPGDTNGIPDVFVRDLQTGTTKLASVGAVWGSSGAPVITPDGRYLAFYSTATNLVGGVPMGGQIYVRDLVAETTVWASAGAQAQAQAVWAKTNVVSFNHALSADGQFVVYETSQSYSTSGLILRYNMTTQVTELVHTNAAVDGQVYEDIRSLAITPDGRYVAFLANTNDTSGQTTCVDVWDAQTGNITLASGDLDGAVAAYSICEWPAISSNGRFVAFLSGGLNLVTNDTPGDYHLYLRDLQSGTTALVDADTNGVGADIGPDAAPSMSADGRFVAFDATDGALVPNDRNHAFDVFVRDSVGGVTELTSAHDPTLPSLTPTGGSELAVTSVSGDGRFIAFSSTADDIVAGDTNQLQDIFVRDLFYGTNVLVSVNTNGVSGNGTSTDPAISADGRYVAFTSYANDLVPGDTNNARDVFVRDLKMGSTTLVSVNTNGTGPGNSASYSPVISTDGRFVLFQSLARNIAQGIVLGANLFIRDRQAGITYALNSPGYSASMTPDGRFVFYNFDSKPTVIVWDSLAVRNIFTNAIASPNAGAALAISSDGKLAAYGISGGLHIIDLAASVDRIIDNTGYSFNNLSFSGDGRLLTCVRTPRSYATNQVYLYDTQTGSATLVSASSPSGLPGNASSDSPQISRDGRFVAYRSAASDLVAGDNNGVPDIFLYDALNGANTLLSASRFGGAPDNRSLTPAFSGDGRTLFFGSWASDLVRQDFNQNSDIFEFSFFYIDAQPVAAVGQGTMLSWPYSPGKNYQAQFKDSLGDTNWHDLTGTWTNTGNKAWLHDATQTQQRFYRVLTH
jgi:Tol biopolymer transport system component